MCKESKLPELRDHFLPALLSLRRWLLTIRKKECIREFDHMHYLTQAEKGVFFPFRGTVWTGARDKGVGVTAHWFLRDVFGFEQGSLSGPSLGDAPACIGEVSEGAGKPSPLLQRQGGANYCKPMFTQVHQHTESSHMGWMSGASRRRAGPRGSPPTSAPAQKTHRAGRRKMWEWQCYTPDNQKHPGSRCLHRPHIHRHVRARSSEGLLSLPWSPASSGLKTYRAISKKNLPSPGGLVVFTLTPPKMDENQTLRSLKQISNALPSVTSTSSFLDLSLWFQVLMTKPSVLSFAHVFNPVTFRECVCQISSTVCWKPLALLLRFNG